MFIILTGSECVECEMSSDGGAAMLGIDDILVWDLGEQTRLYYQQVHWSSPVTHSHEVNRHPMLSVCVSLLPSPLNEADGSDKPACKDINPHARATESDILICRSLCPPRFPHSPRSVIIFLSQLHTVTQGDLLQYRHAQELFTHR